MVVISGPFFIMLEIEFLGIVQPILSRLAASKSLARVIWPNNLGLLKLSNNSEYQKRSSWKNKRRNLNSLVSAVSTCWQALSDFVTRFAKGRLKKTNLWRLFREKEKTLPKAPRSLALQDSIATASACLSDFLFCKPLCKTSPLKRLSNQLAKQFGIIWLVTHLSMLYACVNTPPEHAPPILGLTSSMPRILHCPCCSLLVGLHLKWTKLQQTV